MAHLPTQPRQRHHTTRYPCTSTGTHTGHQVKRVRAPGNGTRTLVPITHRTQHPTLGPAAQDPPPTPTALSSASDSTTSTKTTTSSASTTTSSSSTAPPKPRGTPPKRASKSVPTARNPATAKAHAPAKSPPAARPKTKTAAKQPSKPVGAPRPQPAAGARPQPKPGATTTARAQPSEDVLYDLRPEPSQTRRQRRPTWRPLAVSDTAATTFMATRTAPGSTSSVPAPLPTLDVSPHPAAQHSSTPNLQAETVRIFTRGSTSAQFPLPTHPHGTGLRGAPRACHRHKSPRLHLTHPRPPLRPRPGARPWTGVDAQTPAAPTAPGEPRVTLSPAAPPRNPATQPTTAAERHAEPRPDETKQTRSRWTPMRTPTGTATPNGAKPKATAVENA